MPEATLSHPILTASPPVTHPWRDNAFLAFWSAGGEVRGVVHVSTSPNADGRRARVSAGVHGLEVEVIEDLAPGTFRSTSIDFDLGGRVTVRHPDVELDLVMSPRFALADYSLTGAIPPLVPGEPLQHLQQCADVEGRAQVRSGGRVERADFEAAGLRDRTWGYRDETAAFVEYVAIMIDLGDAFVTAMKFLADDGSRTCHGFHLAESATPLDGFQVTRDAAGLVSGLLLTPSAGEAVRLRRARRWGGFWVPMGVERTGPTFSAYDEFLSFQGAGAGVVEQGVRKNLW